MPLRSHKTWQPEDYPPVKGGWTGRSLVGSNPEQVPAKDSDVAGGLAEMPVNGATAIEIARAHVRHVLESQDASHRRSFEREFGRDPEFDVVDASLVRLGPVYLRSDPHAPLPPLETLWAVYLIGRLLVLKSSVVVLVSKRDGVVVYHGPANDEG